MNNNININIIIKNIVRFYFIIYNLINSKNNCFIVRKKYERNNREKKYFT